MEGEAGNVPDLAEFEILFRRNHKFLCLQAMDYVQDQFVAEDIVQDFFMDFWQRRHSIQLSSSFEAYARRAVKYKCIDYLRKNAVAEKRNDLLASISAMENGADEQDQQEKDHNRYLQIVALMDSLPESRRNIFLMHAVERMSYAQIAEKQQISLNTVKTQLKRAYAALRNKAIVLILTLICLFALI